MIKEFRIARNNRLTKEFRVATNNRLFKEVLCGSSTAELIVRSSDSPFVKYRNYKRSITCELTPDRTLELRNLIRDRFAKLEVDLTLIQLTITEVESVVTVYFAEIKGRKLTESQLSLINYLREKTAREREKKAHQKRFEEAKSLRLFLRNQYVTYVKSSKDRNEFLKIKQIHQTYLEKIPYDKVQIDFLEKLKQRTRDLSNNFNNSQSKKKTGLTLTKNLQEVEKNMIGKEKGKDQKHKRFSKEKYEQDYGKLLSEEKYKRALQREVQEARKDISFKLDKIIRYLENSKKDCVRCNYRGTYNGPIEFSFAEYEDTPEKDLEKVTCVKSKKVVQDVCYISYLFNNYETTERIEEDKCAEDKGPVPSEEIVQKLTHEKTEDQPRTIVSKDDKLPLTKIKKSPKIKETSKKRSQKRIKKQRKRIKKARTRLNRSSVFESGIKERVAINREYRRFSRTLKSATIKFYERSNQPITELKDAQAKLNISELNKKFPLNSGKIPLPYNDPKSRIEHDDKLLEKYLEEKETKKQDFLKQGLIAKNTNGLPRLTKSDLQPIKAVFESYFNDYNLSTKQILIRNKIKECIGYSGGSDALRIVNNKRILKKKVRKLARKEKPCRTVLKSVKSKGRTVRRSYSKYRANKEPVAVQTRVKNAFKKSIVPNAVKFLAIFGITFISLMAFVSPETFNFPVEVISGFLYVQVFVYLIFLYLSIENYVFSVRKLFYLFISPLILFGIVFFFVSLEWMVAAAACTPLAAFQSHRMKKRRLRINVNKIPLNSKGCLRYGTITIFYHQFKFPILTVLSLMLGVVFIWTYFFDPYSTITAPAMLTLIIFAFTFKSKKITRKIVSKLKRQKQKERGIRTSKKNLVVIYDKNKRAALLILVFLVIFPITFGVNSMYSVQNPEYGFAYISQEERLSTSSIDFSSLDYLPGLDDLEELSINGKFVIKCDISPLLGQAARVWLELIPKNVPPIEGFYAKRSYNVLSPHLNGPLEAHELITEVNLNELNLMPGTYEAKITYTILTGFSFRTSTPEVYEITIAKDDLTVISNDIFEEVLDSKYYGAVYTFEHPNDGSWTVVFDGKLVNSIREPLPTEKLDLFVEQNDRYEKIETVTTKKDGTFYYKHKVYGSIEQNMLVKISRAEDGFYNPMNYVEYAGLEFDAENGRYFLDVNEDLYPDWPFSIYDLLKAHTSSYTPPSSLDFWAKFDENLGYSTFDEIHSLEGTLEGNTNWTDGKNDYGLEFDGEGEPIVQENVTSTIYAMYANVSYEYEGVGEVEGSEGYYDPGTAQNVQDGGIDWTSPDNAKTQNNTYAIANSIAKRKRSDILRVTNFGFDVPTTATIDGIHVRIDRRASAADSIRDRTVNLVLGGITQGSSKADLVLYWPTSDQYMGYGGATDNWGASLDASDINSGTFGVQFQVDNKDTSTARSAYIDHIEMIVYYTESGAGSQVNSSIVLPNEDIVSQWNASAPVDHYSLLNEEVEESNAPETNSGFIFTSSMFQGSYIVDELNMSTFSVQDGNVTEISIKIYGNETTIDSTVDVYCGSWLGEKQLDMSSSPGWNTYTWSGLSLPQTDLDGMKIRFNSTTPESQDPEYQNFDFVQFGDVLDSTLGASNDKFVVTGWLFPTSLTSDQNENGIKNLFFAKEGNIEIGINESGFVQIYLSNATTEAVGTYGFDNAIPLNQWTYIAIRYNKSDVDVLIGDMWCRDALGGISEPWNGGSYLKSGGALTIGANYSCFAGIIDEISVFNISLTDAEIEAHMGDPSVSIFLGVAKEDGQGGWTFITTLGELIGGYLNFEVNATDNEVESMEFYLSRSQPDFQTQTEADWDFLASFSFDSAYYSYLLNSRDLPDSNSWYFVCKATDVDENVVYEYYNTYFAIEHFHDLINYTYLDKDGRINHNSNLGVVPIDGFEWHISSLNLYVNYSNDIDYLKSVSYTDLYSYYWLIDLVELQNWASNKGLSPDNYEISFVVQANLSYSFGEPFYLYNYTLETTILDVKGPDLELITGGEYSLVLGSTYDEVENNVINMGISSIDADFDKVTLEYRYETPTTADWVKYGDFDSIGSLADVYFDVINLRDENVTIRFIGFDDLSNSFTLYQGNYWLVKDFNNHENFVVEGLEGGSIYGLDQDGMVDLHLKVIPVDNDITYVWISTGYETFQLNNVESEGDHIYFTDDGVIDVDIKLDSSKYPISGTDFAFINVSVVLYQGDVRIADKKVVITVITRVFNDIVEISDLVVNITESINNIRMSFVNDNNAYNNSHSIPFVVNNIPPVVKVFNSHGVLVYALDLSANYDYLLTLNLTESQLSSSTNSPQTTSNVDRTAGGGPTDSGWMSPQATTNIDRYLGSFSNEITSSPQTITSVDRSGSVDWVNLNNVQSQNDAYALADMVVSGGSSGIPVIELWTEQGDTDPSAPITLAKPSGVESGDLLLLIAMNDAPDATAFSDNKVGWNFVDTSGNDVSDAHIAVFWRIADGTEGPTETVTSAGEDEWVGYYLRITGADDTNPINVYNFEQSSSVSSSHIIPAITSTVDDCLMLYGLSFDGGDGYTFDVSGTGWSEVDEHQTGTNGANDASGCFGSRELASQGSSGSATVGCSVSDGAAYFQLAIAPSSGASGSAETDYLRATNFGFDVPNGATIEGITVEIDKCTNVTNSVMDYSIQLRDSTGPIGDIKTNASYWNDSDFDYYAVYGGSDFLWGTSWTIAEIESSLFGVDIVADTDTSALASIDHIRIIINYSVSLSGEPWQDPSKTTSQDNDNAYVSFSSITESTSDWLRLTDFGFTIPDATEITGIEIRIDRDSSVSDSIKDAEIYLRKTTGQIGNNLSNGLWWDTTNDNYDLYGGSSELWGASWNYAEINSPDFGIDLFVKYFDAVPVEARIDHLQIKVYYTESPKSQEEWTNPSKVIDQDDDETFVSFNTATETSSDWLRLTNFGFDLPDGATILGIFVEMDRYSTLADSIWDGSVFLRNSLGQLDYDNAMGGYWNSIDNDIYDFYGGPTDLWETTWTVADVNIPNFGVDIFVNSSGLVTTEARIDQVRITIYYSTPSSDVVIVDNKFTVNIPSLPVGEELCSIEEVRVNGTSYDHSYFIDAINGTILITLLSPINLDGSYDSFSPVFMDIGVSTSFHDSDQFIASFDFSQLPQDNYTFVGEFLDITGVISQFTVNTSISIDFHGPQIYSQFTNNCSINPESGSISFVVSDLSGVLSYYFNATIDGYWTLPCEKFKTISPITRRKFPAKWKI